MMGWLQMLSVVSRCHLQSQKLLNPINREFRMMKIHPQGALTKELDRKTGILWALEMASQQMPPVQARGPEIDPNTQVNKRECNGMHL